MYHHHSGFLERTTIRPVSHSKALATRQLASYNCSGGSPLHFQMVNYLISPKLLTLGIDATCIASVHNGLGLHAVNIAVLLDSPGPSNFLFSHSIALSKRTLIHPKLLFVIHR